jgi:hypothetical protein
MIENKLWNAEQSTKKDGRSSGQNKHATNDMKEHNSEKAQQTAVGQQSNEQLHSVISSGVLRLCMPGSALLPSAVSFTRKRLRNMLRV